MTPRALLVVPALFLALCAAVLPVRAEDQSALGADVSPAPKPSKKKAPAKKKTFDYDRSKYKSREPSQTTNYKFNEKGDPITAETKKKASAKKKKRSEPPEAAAPEAASCGSEDSCIEKKTEADAL